MTKSAPPPICQPMFDVFEGEMPTINIAIPITYRNHIIFPSFLYKIKKCANRS